MKIFWASSQIDTETKKGKLSFGSAENRHRFQLFLDNNIGVRFRIDPYTPESSKQRRWFEGALIPFLTYFQDNLDWRDTEDLAKVRDWVKIEFNGQFITLHGKANKVPKSTRNQLNRGLIERIMDWAAEQGYPTDLLLPEKYKDWHDRIRPYEGPPTFIEYLEETSELKKLTKI